MRGGRARRGRCGGDSARRESPRRSRPVARTLAPRRSRRVSQQLDRGLADHRNRHRRSSRTASSRPETIESSSGFSRSYAILRYASERAEQSRFALKKARAPARVKSCCRATGSCGPVPARGLGVGRRRWSGVRLLGLIARFSDRSHPDECCNRALVHGSPGSEADDEWAATRSGLGRRLQAIASNGLMYKSLSRRWLER